MTEIFEILKFFDALPLSKNNEYSVLRVFIMNIIVMTVWIGIVKQCLNWWNLIPVEVSLLPET